MSYVWAAIRKWSEGHTWASAGTLVEEPENVSAVRVDLATRWPGTGPTPRRGRTPCCSAARENLAPFRTGDRFDFNFHAGYHQSVRFCRIHRSCDVADWPLVERLVISWPISIASRARAGALFGCSITTWLVSFACRRKVACGRERGLVGAQQPPGGRDRANRRGTGHSLGASDPHRCRAARYTAGE